MNYPNCPICGYAEMPYAPAPYNICPCCGTEFGVDDRETNHQVLRQTWIKTGMLWFDVITSPPPGWSASLQLINAGYGADLIAPTGSATTAGEESIYLPTKTFWSPAELSTCTAIVSAA